MPTEADASHSRLGKAVVGGVLFGLFILGSHPASANLFAPPLDKLVHALVFAILAAAISAAWPRLGWFAVLLIVAGISLADELHQFLVPQRQPGWDDGIADLVGAGAGLLAWRFWRRSPT